MARFERCTTFNNFDEWEKTLRPCDLLLFSVKDISGNCIRFFQNTHLKTNSFWTHAGIVCPHNFIDFKNKQKNNSYVLESLVSGFDGTNNIETNKLHNGLQIRELRQVVQNVIDNDGVVGCFHIKKSYFQYSVLEERNLTDDDIQAYIASHEYTDVFNTFWNDFRNAKYDFCNVSRSAGFKIPFMISKKKKKRLFCSEAVVELYKIMKLVNTNIEAELISPEELARWTGDVLGYSPFDNSPSIIKAVRA